MLDECKHDVIQATRKSTYEKSNCILNGASFEVETEGTDDSSKHKVMEIVVLGAMEAYQVINVNGWDHVGCVRVEASANALQKSKKSVIA